jgi:F0F1-type ATP synthase assembly protein I
LRKPACKIVLNQGVTERCAKIHKLMGSRKESPLAILMHALPPAVVGTMVLQIAAIVGCLVIGSLVLGLFADKQLGTKPLFTLLFALISLFVSVWLTYRIALRTSAKAQKAYQVYLDSKRAAAQQEQQAHSTQEGESVTHALTSDR